MATLIGYSKTNPNSNVIALYFRLNTGWKHHIVVHDGSGVADLITLSNVKEMTPKEFNSLPDKETK